jgi:hypothetical protein
MAAIFRIGVAVGVMLEVVEDAVATATAAVEVFSLTGLEVDVEEVEEEEEDVCVLDFLTAPNTEERMINKITITTPPMTNHLRCLDSAATLHFFLSSGTCSFDINSDNSAF